MHHLLDELAVDRVVDDLVDVLEASELTAVAESRVRTVEKAKLVHFELFNIVDILDDLDADLLEGRAAITELVLNDPLHEGLSDNGPFIFNTKVFGKGGDVGLFGAGSDTVDHGVGEGTLLGDPVSDFGVGESGEGNEHVTSDGAVFLHVVAGEDGEGVETELVASVHGSVEETEGGLGRVLVLEIVLDVGVLSLELVGVLVVVVAGFGDGHGNDLGVGVGHLVDDSLAVVGRKEERGDGAIDVGGAAVGAALDDSVEVVLLLQDVAHGSVEGLKTDTGDSKVADAMLLHQVVEIDGQVSSVEAADTDVNDSFLDRRAIISRNSDSCTTRLRRDL